MLDLQFRVLRLNLIIPNISFVLYFGLKNKGESIIVLQPCFFLEISFITHSTEEKTRFGIVTTRRIVSPLSIGRDHLRVPSGIPLPASGLSAASELSLESTQRGTTASQRAERSEWTACQPAG